MSSFVLAIIVILVTISVAICGLLLVRKFVPSGMLAENHQVAAAMLGTLGTLYAIVLGLVVVQSLERRHLAETQESIEASNLVTISHLCRGMNKDFRIPLLETEIAYMYEVVNEEWPQMRAGNIVPPDGGKTLSDLWGVVARFEPRTMREQNIHAAMLASLTAVTEARHNRIVLCHSNLPLFLWVVLVVGATCVIGYTYLFSPKHVKLQVLMTCVITLVFCLNFLLALFFSRPYQGDTAIEPVNMRRSLVGLQKRKTLREAEEQNAPTAP